MNPAKPRSKSFEISLIKKGKGTIMYVLITFSKIILDIIIWSGLKRGPPRKLKFPESEVIIAALREHI